MTRLRATFQSLSNHNYRLYFVGQTISVTGTWMQKIGQAWLVLELTGSGTLLGLTAALQHLPTLLIGPWAGLLADRADKRKVILTTQSLSGVLALVLGAATLTGNARLWIVLALALALGVLEALDKPARNTFVHEMVGSGLLTNAVTLNSVVINAGKVVGPAIAGALIAGVGLGYSFLLNGVSYFAVVAALSLMREHELERATPARRGRGQVREGLAYVRRTPELLAPIVLMTVVGMLAYEWAVSLPLLATDAFGGDARTFSLMFSAMGIGAIVGGLFVAGSLRASTRSLLAITGVFSVVVVVASAAPTLPLALLALLLVGGVGIAFKAAAMSLVQLQAAPEMRGRVMALLVIANTGTTPLGAPLVGWVGETFGARVALGMGGVAAAVAAVATLSYLWRRGALDRATRAGGVEVYVGSSSRM